jgi:putative flippase GtrA
MARAFSFDSAVTRFRGLWRSGTLSLKATSFALIGLVNTAVDYGFFLLARMALEQSAAAVAMFALLSGLCRCGASQTLLLVTANMMSWAVAISGSYVMNSSITFAAESGRKLRWRAYGTFVVAGIAGLIANTATLVFIAQILIWPVWLAKGFAVLASFVVNFSLSHFYIFRPRHAPTVDAGEAR